LWQVQYEDEKRFIDEVAPLLEALPAQPINFEAARFKANSDDNNLILSTIEDYLAPFKEDKTLVSDNYGRLVKSLLEYIESGMFPADVEPIKVGRTNKKRLGWAINRILKCEGIGIEYELLKFAKEKISIYSEDKLEKTNFRKGNLYKYFTEKVK
jgi:hypothetical protein